jgi:hypothetical protein
MNVGDGFSDLFLCWSVKRTFLHVADVKRHVMASSMLYWIGDHRHDLVDGASGCVRPQRSEFA